MSDLLWRCIHGNVKFMKKNILGALLEQKYFIEMCDINCV